MNSITATWVNYGILLTLDKYQIIVHWEHLQFLPNFAKIAIRNFGGSGME